MTIERTLRLDGRTLRPHLIGPWPLGEPVLVSLHRFRRAQLVPVGFDELVPHDDVSA